ncbi:hypothetical protein CAEBREN_09148 [Caenorhabditis brenneri]|uniref:PAN-3 domain-containing protein n=1 Tax=Caenorhabditis brenneri TaxID=135651 RepID=G0NCJ9_CAEBE|nr:hypothetical protein CAEBREN_09148 [Caenorhabditis brenneri]
MNLLSLLILPFLSPIQSSSDIRMVIVWGKVESSNTPVPFAGTWNDCLRKCLDEETCVLTGQTAEGCQLYRIGNVTLVTKTDATSGTRLGFKRTLPTKCPTNNNAPLFGETNVSETYSSETMMYQYSIRELHYWESSVSGDPIEHVKWQFSVGYFIQCQNDSFVVVRESGRCCVSVRPFPSPSFCQNRAAAPGLCSTNGGISLTGPADRAEALLYSEKYQQVIKNQPGGTYTIYHFWLDGYRTAEGSVKYSMDDPTHSGTTAYDWDKRPENAESNFMCVCMTPGSSRNFFAHSCGLTFNEEYCVRGAVCRTKPVLSS